MHKHVATLAVLLSLGAWLPSQSRADARMRFIDLDRSHHRYDYAPSVLWDGTKWLMYYCGHKYPTASEPESDGIFRATSSDGVHWSAEASAPVLSIGSPGTWDAGNVCDPSVIMKPDPFFGQVYYLYYTGTTGGWQNDQIGLALSVDGINFFKQGVTVPNCKPCTMPSVARTDNGTWYLAFNSRSTLFSNYMSAVMTSTNGQNWTSPTGIAFEGGADGVDIMWDSQGWHAVTIGRNCNTPNSGAAHQSQYVYRFPSLRPSPGMSGLTIPHSSLVACIDGSEAKPKVPLGPPASANTTMNESGFFRSASGARPSWPALWIAFASQPYAPNAVEGACTDNSPHCGLEEIDAAAVGPFDGEAGLDELWGGLCFNSNASIWAKPAVAWSYDGPLGDDVNFWDMARNGASTTFCDMKLTNLPTTIAGMRTASVRWAVNKTAGSGPANFEIWFGGLRTPVSGPTSTINTSVIDVTGLSTNLIFFRSFTSDIPNGASERFHVYDVTLAK